MPATSPYLNRPTLSERERLELDVQRASQALKRFPKGPMGLTPAHVKASPGWRAAREAYRVAFERLRAYNARRNTRTG